MPIYLALWGTPKFEEEVYGDPASRHLVRWLRRAQMRNDLWCVETRRVSREHPWSIFVWWRPRDARGVMMPAPSAVPTGVCDEYYRCGPRGVDGGFVRLIGPRQAAVRTGHCLMLVPSGEPPASPDDGGPLILRNVEGMSVYVKSGGPPKFEEARYSDACGQIAVGWMRLLWEQHDVRAIRTRRDLLDSAGHNRGLWILEVWWGGRRARRRRPKKYDTLLWGRCDALYLVDARGVRGGAGRLLKTLEKSAVYLWEPGK